MEENKRPWGEYDVLLDKPYTKVKEITVKPHSRLSLQLHKNRAEYWIIVQGTPVVTLGEESKQVVEGMLIFIPRETKHRIANITDEPVKFIEVQIGDSFDEYDITRLEDDYGRADTPGNIDTSKIKLF
jgi:mannose-6-phosphate isomerase-like protein (cupin superfamily)